MSCQVCADGAVTSSFTVSSSRKTGGSIFQRMKAGEGQPANKPAVLGGWGATLQDGEIGNIGHLALLISRG